MLKAAELQQELQNLGSPDKAKASAWFFKTGPGQYGEGDQFIGVTLPEQRQIAKKYHQLPLPEIKKLIMSRYHEERLTALIILVNQYKKGDEAHRNEIYDFYLAHTNRVNNWDLVDVSAAYIVGPWLEHREKIILVKLAKSDNLWERRIAIMSTFYFIRQGDSAETFKIAELLLGDNHDLIHKAVGWMLREVGKKCGRYVEEEFLLKHYRVMPRTMLRYAIEHFPEERRQQYLKGTA